MGALRSVCLYALDCQLAVATVAESGPEWTGVAKQVNLTTEVGKDPIARGVLIEVGSAAAGGVIAHS